MPCPSIDPKLFWTHSNCFGLDQHVLNMVKSWFLSGSKCFESIKKIGTGLNNFGPVQNISRHIGQGKKLNEKCFEILTMKSLIRMTNYTKMCNKVDDINSEKKTNFKKLVKLQLMLF